MLKRRKRHAPGIVRNNSSSCGWWQWHRFQVDLPDNICPFIACDTKRAYWFMIYEATRELISRVFPFFLVAYMNARILITYRYVRLRFAFVEFSDISFWSFTMFRSDSETRKKIVCRGCRILKNGFCSKKAKRWARTSTRQFFTSTICNVE